MNEQTPITTAARRITREANTRRQGFRLYFDAEGRLVETVFGPEAFGPRPEVYTYYIAVMDRPLTQRDVQDAMGDQDEIRKLGFAPDGTPIR